MNILKSESELSRFVGLNHLPFSLYLSEHDQLSDGVQTDEENLVRYTHRLMTMQFGDKSNGSDNNTNNNNTNNNNTIKCLVPRSNRASIMGFL